MATNFTDNLRGIINTDPLAKDSPLDIRNIINRDGASDGGKKGSNRRMGFLETIIDAIMPVPTYNAGESQPENSIIPKVPSFTSPDPVWRELQKSDMTDSVKERIWEGYQADLDTMDDDKKIEFRRRLGTSADDFEAYYNSLLERDRRGTLQPMIDLHKMYGENKMDERGNIWLDPMFRWKGNFDSYRRMRDRASTGAGVKRSK